VLVIR